MRRNILFIKDAGLSTGWNLGAENPIRLNLRNKSIIAVKKSITSRNTVLLLLIKFFKFLFECLNKNNLIISIGYILFTITISYTAQIPWKIKIIVLHSYIRNSNTQKYNFNTHNGSNSSFFT